MKKLISVTMLFFSSVICTGCGGLSNAIISDGKSTFGYHEMNASILGPWHGPESIARAYAIKTKVDIDKMMMEAYYSGKTSDGKPVVKYAFAMVNVTDKKAYVMDPERGDLIALSANNGSEIIFTSELPDRFVFKNDRGRVIWQPKPESRKMESKKTFRGRTVDMIFYLTRQ